MYRGLRGQAIHEFDAVILRRCNIPARAEAIVDWLIDMAVQA